MDILPRRCLRTDSDRTMMTTAIAMMRIITMATTPPMMAVVLLVELCGSVAPGSSVVGIVVELVGGMVSGVGSSVTVGGGWVVVGGEHSLSLSDGMATEHWGLTVSSIPVTLKPGSPLTQSSIREMRALLAV